MAYNGICTLYNSVNERMNELRNELIQLNWTKRVANTGVPTQDSESVIRIADRDSDSCKPITSST